MPEIAVPQTSDIHLVVGTTGSNMPFTYYIGTELAGYDVELAMRFAAWLGATLEFKVYDYDGIIAAAQCGDVDCIFANLFVTPERAESLRFSEPTFVGEIGVMVRDETAETADAPAESISLSDLEHSRIGIQTGSTHAALVQELLPNASILYYNTYADLLAALRDDKIDAFPSSELTLRPMLTEYPQPQTVEGVALLTADLGFAAAKTPEGQALCDELSAWFSEITADGEMDAILARWTEAPDSERTVPDWTALPADRGTLHMATEGGFPPYEYYQDGKLVGIEIDLAARFCAAKGYALQITDMNFESVLPSVSAGKSDFAASGIAITPERQETLSFTQPYFTERVVLVTMERETQPHL